MKHFEIRNLSKELDSLLQYILDNKITNSYLNYGLVRNAKILSKAAALIEGAIPTRLKEIETEMFQSGLKKYLESPGEIVSKEYSEAEKNANVFNIGYETSTQEIKDERELLMKDYNVFLDIESDTELYYIKFEGVKDIQMELPYWNILDNFIKE